METIWSDSGGVGNLLLYFCLFNIDFAVRYLKTCCFPKTRCLCLVIPILSDKCHGTCPPRLQLLAFGSTSFLRVRALWRQDHVWLLSFPVSLRQRIAIGQREPSGSGQICNHPLLWKPSVNDHVNFVLQTLYSVCMTNEFVIQIIR